MSLAENFDTAKFPFPSAWKSAIGLT